MSDRTNPPRNEPTTEDRIVVDPAVRFGKPIIRGTRITVDEVLGRLASGLSKEDVAVDFDLEIEDVHAALRHAAASVANEHRWAE